MTREETLNILQQVNDTIDSMTDEELYDYMMKTSPSFRKTIGRLDKFIEDNDMNQNEIFDEYGNYKYPWEPTRTPTDVSTTGKKPLSEQLMDLGIIDGDTVKPTPTKIDYIHSNFSPENKQRFAGEVDPVHHDSLSTEPSSQINGKIENNDPSGTKKEYICDSKIKKEDVHLERIGNKVVEDSTTPIDSREDLERRENAELKKAYIPLSLEEIKILNKMLQNYKGALYREINRLLEEEEGVSYLVKEKLNELIELIDFIPKIQNFLTVWKSSYKGPDIAYSKYSWEPNGNIVNITNELTKNVYKIPGEDK